MLWGLTQESLKRTIFPLADLTKKEVRKIAVEKGFADLANKSESYEICFIPDNDYRGFLRRKVKDIDTLAGEGNFIRTDGTIMMKKKDTNMQQMRNMMKKKKNNQLQTLRE